MMSSLSNKPSIKKIVDDIQECVGSLKSTFNDLGRPITDDSIDLQRLCVKLEFLLKHGQTERSSFLSGKKDYWNYFVEALSSTKGVSDGLKVVRGLTELKSNLGRGRAFIRFCLMYQRLADCLQLCISNEKLTSQWYQPTSVWLNTDLSAYLISILYDLNNITFDLGSQGYDLDNGWPSFARTDIPYKKWSIPISPASSLMSLNSSSVSESHYMNSSFLEQESNALIDQLEEAELPKSDLEVNVGGAQSEERRIIEAQKDTIERLTDELSLTKEQLSSSINQQPMFHYPEEAFLCREHVDTKYQGITRKLSEVILTSGENTVDCGDCTDRAAADRAAAECLHDNKMEPLELSLASIENTVNAMKTEIGTLEHQFLTKKHLSEDNQILIGNISNLAQHNQMLELAVHHAQQQVEEYKFSQLGSREGTTSSHQIEQESLSEQLEHTCFLLQQREATVQRYEMDAIEAKDLREKLQQLEIVKDGVIGELSAKLAKNDEELSSHSENLAALTEELSNTKLQLMATENAKTILLEEIEKNKEHALVCLEQKSELENIIKACVCEKSELQDQLVKFTNDNSHIISALNEMRMERDQLSTQLKQQAIEMQELNKVCDSINHHKDDVELRASILELEKDKLSSNLQQVLEDVDLMRSQLSTLRQQEVERSGELNELQSRLNVTRKEWANSQQVLEQQISALKFQLSSHQMEAETAIQGYKDQQAEVYKLGHTVSSQERIIAAIEIQLDSLLEERTIESEAHAAHLEELNSILRDKEEETVAVLEELETYKKQFSQMAEVNEVMNESVIAAKLECNQRIADNENELHQLREDNLMLKKRLVKLIKDKDNLWKKTDELVFRQKMMAEIKWIDSASVTQCMGCRAQFSLLLRKHHCRICGRVFCWQCSNNWIDTVVSRGKSRVCNQCFIEQSQPLPDALCSVLMPDNEEIILPAEISMPRWMVDGKQSEDNSVATTPDSVTQVETRAVQDADHYVMPASSEDAEIKPAEAGGNTFAPLSYAASSLPAHKPHSSTEPHPVLNSTMDADFEEITDDEVARSLGESADLGRGSLRGSLSSLSPWILSKNAEELSQRFLETVVLVGAPFSICINVHKVDTHLTWQFETRPKSIMFGITYRPTLTSSTDDIIPLCRCDSHKQLIVGEMIAHNPGLYLFAFSTTDTKQPERKLKIRVFSS